jgi:hypothetical protein
LRLLEKLARLILKLNRDGQNTILDDLMVNHSGYHFDFSPRRETAARSEVPVFDIRTHENFDVDGESGLAILGVPLLFTEVLPGIRKLLPNVGTAVTFDEISIAGAVALLRRTVPPAPCAVPPEFLGEVVVGVQETVTGIAGNFAG